MKPLLVVLILMSFFMTGIIGPMPAYAQDYRLPVPGVMVNLSPAFAPPILKGIKVHPDNPFRFEFILDKGDSQLGSDQLKDESSKLIKYFLASLTIPEKDLWVNLSPYEKERIIPKSFGLTVMGRDLLAEDYMLKQITASLIFPEAEIGKRFWQRIYTETAKRFGATNIPVNTFNKVWIVPEKAVLYENAKAGTAYVVDSKLKVMLEQDYLSLQKHEGIMVAAKVKDTNQLGSQIVREIVIPELTTEVNENKNFANLRQVYNSLILATWYKKKIKDSILEQVYVDRNKVAGVNIDDSKEKQRIYERYLRAFKKGVFNYIKEEADGLFQETITRKYFSGGVSMGEGKYSISVNETIIDDKTASPAMLSNLLSSLKNLSGELLVMASLSAAMAKPAGNYRAMAVGHLKGLFVAAVLNALTLGIGSPLLADEPQRSGNTMPVITEDLTLLEQVMQGDERAIKELVGKLRDGDISFFKELLGYVKYGGVESSIQKKIFLNLSDLGDLSKIDSVDVLDKLFDVFQNHKALDRIKELIDNNSLDAARFYFSYFRGNEDDLYVKKSYQILDEDEKYHPTNDDTAKSIKEDVRKHYLPKTKEFRELIFKIARFYKELTEILLIMHNDLSLQEKFDLIDAFPKEERLNLLAEISTQTRLKTEDEKAVEHQIADLLNVEPIDDMVFDGSKLYFWVKEGLKLPNSHWLNLKLVHQYGEVPVLAQKAILKDEKSLDDLIQLAKGNSSDKTAARSKLIEIFNNLNFEVNDKIWDYVSSNLTEIFKDLDTESLYSRHIRLYRQDTAKASDYFLIKDIFRLASTDEKALALLARMKYERKIPVDNNIWVSFFKNITPHAFNYGDSFNVSLLNAYLENTSDPTTMLFGFLDLKKEGLDSRIDKFIRAIQKEKDKFILKQLKKVQYDEIDRLPVAADSKIWLVMLLAQAGQGQFEDRVSKLIFQSKDPLKSFGLVYDNPNCTTSFRVKFDLKPDLYKTRVLSDLELEDLITFAKYGNLSALNIVLSHPEGLTKELLSHFMTDLKELPRDILNRIRDAKLLPTYNVPTLQFLATEGNLEAKNVIGDSSPFGYLYVNEIKSFDAPEFQLLKQHADIFINNLLDQKIEGLRAKLSASNNEVRNVLLDSYMAVLIELQSKTRMFDVDSFNQVVYMLKDRVKMLITYNNANSSGEVGFALITQMKSVEEFFWMIAHEMGHNFLRAMFNFDPADNLLDNTIHEFSADLVGIKFMQIMGFSFDVYEKYQILFPKNFLSDYLKWQEQHAQARLAIGLLIKHSSSKKEAYSLLVKMYNNLPQAIQNHKIEHNSFKDFFLGLTAEALGEKTFQADSKLDLEGNVGKLLNKAMRAQASRMFDKGGIDFNPANINLQIKNNGLAIKFYINAAQLAQLQDAPGFVPVIINIRLLKNISTFLGIQNTNTPSING